MAEGGLWVKEQDVGSKKPLKHQSKETSNFACIPCVLTKNAILYRARTGPEQDFLCVVILTGNSL